MKTLVVYYSLTGHVGRLAKEIAERLGADIEAIRPDGEYSGKEGYSRAGKEAMLRARPRVGFGIDPSSYDLVVVGSPMWAFTVSSPMRSYLAQNRGRFKNVAFFSSFGGFPWALEFGSMERACGKKPVAKLRLKEAEIDSGEYTGRLDGFVAAISASRQ